ncbi:hypothetical protein, partial [Streptomyces sp. NPDC007110]|uniref:hypothetical protein n=1 Tax=Streptomyces sp. NPDC007110 TaxID=3156916 RepID=UPI0033CE8B41
MRTDWSSNCSEASPCWELAQDVNQPFEADGRCATAAVGADVAVDDDRGCAGAVGIVAGLPVGLLGGGDERA